jgi:hypothetical protein
MKRHILVAITIIALLAGCALVKQESFTISNGETVNLLVERGWPTQSSGALGTSMFPSENEGFRIVEIGTYHIDSEKNELTYSFRIQAKNSSSLTSIKIEDVSDEQAQLLVEDSAPKLTKSEWTGYATPKKITDRNLHWIMSDQDSVRIYRFTIITDTKKKTVMYQAIVLSREYKSFLRRVLVST